MEKCLVWLLKNFREFSAPQWRRTSGEAGLLCTGKPVVLTINARGSDLNHRGYNSIMGGADFTNKVAVSGANGLF